MFLVRTIRYLINKRIVSENKRYPANQNIMLHYLYCSNLLWPRLSMISMYNYEVGLTNKAITINHFQDGIS